MITTFKTFNTKTKEVKEYSKPEFGDFGEYILINGNDIDTLSFQIENTAHFSDDKIETIQKLKNLAIAISVTYNKNKFNKNTDHELNTLYNGLFKDYIYTSGDWVGVLQKSFEYKDKIYKVGDIFSLSYSRGVENTVYDLELRMLRYDGMCFIDNWFKHCHTRNKKDTENINNYKLIYNLDTTIDKKYFLFNYSTINNKFVEHQGNLLDEYFTDSNRLAKLIL